MHAVLITFKSEAGLADLKQPFTDYAVALRDVDGPISKTWIRDGDVLGGFHVFASEADAQRYLGSEMVAGLTSNEAFSGWEINHYDVLDEFSRITGSPQAALVRR